MLGFKQRIIYLIITRELISIRYIVGTREVARFEDVPQVAFTQGTRTVIAGGQAADEGGKLPEHTRFRAFDHPRVAVCNIDDTLPLIRWFFARLKEKTGGLMLVNRVVMHWQDKTTRELAEPEKHGFLRLGAEIQPNTGGVFICQLSEELDPKELQEIFQGKWTQNDAGA